MISKDCVYRTTQYYCESFSPITVRITKNDETRAKASTVGVIRVVLAVFSLFTVVIPVSCALLNCCFKPQKNQVDRAVQDTFKKSLNSNEKEEIPQTPSEEETKEESTVVPFLQEQEPDAQPQSKELLVEDGIQEGGEPSQTEGEIQEGPSEEELEKQEVEVVNLDQPSPMAADPNDLAQMRAKIQDTFKPYVYWTERVDPSFEEPLKNGPSYFRIAPLKEEGSERVQYKIALQSEHALLPIYLEHNDQTVAKLAFLRKVIADPALLIISEKGKFDKFCQKVLIKVCCSETGESYLSIRSNAASPRAKRVDLQKCSIQEIEQAIEQAKTRNIEVTKTEVLKVFAGRATWIDHYAYSMQVEPMERGHFQIAALPWNFIGRTYRVFIQSTAKKPVEVDLIIRQDLVYLLKKESEEKEKLEFLIRDELVEKLKILVDLSLCESVLFVHHEINEQSDLGKEPTKLVVKVMPTLQSSALQRSQGLPRAGIPHGNSFRIGREVGVWSSSLEQRLDFKYNRLTAKNLYKAISIAVSVTGSTLKRQEQYNI